MNRVTVSADDIGEGMLRAANIGLRKIACVAVEASVQDGFGLHQREGARNGGRAAAGFDVGFTGSVTAFASGALGWLIAARDALVMRILIEVEPDVGVTSFTYRAPDVVCRRH